MNRICPFCWGATIKSGLCTVCGERAPDALPLGPEIVYTVVLAAFTPKLTLEFMSDGTVRWRT